MWLVSITRGEESETFKMESVTESEAIREAEICVTDLIGDGWKADWQKFEIKITLYKVEKEITVFERK